LQRAFQCAQGEVWLGWGDHGSPPLEGDDVFFFAFVDIHKSVFYVFRHITVSALISSTAEDRAFRVFKPLVNIIAKKQAI